jgi:hypothetical protein
MERPTLTAGAVARIAENRIREAREEGAFDDVPGLGRPIPDIDEPYDPLGWVRRWLVRAKLREAMTRLPCR